MAARKIVPPKAPVVDAEPGSSVGVSLGRFDVRRRQHPAFGSEIRRLLSENASVEEREQGAVVVEELRALDAAKASGRNHHHEDALHGEGLSKIRYLKLYTKGYSIRVYFTLVGSTIWMLAIDVNKRRHNVSGAMEERLLERRSDVVGSGGFPRSEGSPR